MIQDYDRQFCVKNGAQVWVWVSIVIECGPFGVLIASLWQKRPLPVFTVCQMRRDLSPAPVSNPNPNPSIVLPAFLARQMPQWTCCWCTCCGRKQQQQTIVTKILVKFKGQGVPQTEREDYSCEREEYDGERSRHPQQLGHSESHL